jgi:DnaJ domain
MWRAFQATQLLIYIGTDSDLSKRIRGEEYRREIGDGNYRRDRSRVGTGAAPLMHDPWGVLGLSRTSSESQVRDSFRAAALRWHPDRPGGCAARFQEVSSAYESISADIARRQYQQRQPPSARRTQGGRSRPPTNIRWQPQTQHDFTTNDTSADTAWRRERRSPSSESTFWVEARRSYHRRAAGVPGLGLGLGVVCVAVVASTAVFVLDTTYAAVNKGKGFHDVQEALAAARAKKVEAEVKRKPHAAARKAKLQQEGTQDDH